MLKISLIGLKNIMRKKNTKVSIIGVGYVGLPLALAFSKKFKTIGFDLNKDRINDIKLKIDSLKLSSPYFNSNQYCADLENIFKSLI